MRTDPVSVILLGMGFFVGSLAVGVLVASCGGSGTPADGGTSDVDPYSLGPCRDGTYQILSCVGSDGGPAPETFSDESCLSLDDAEHRGAVVHDDTRAPGIDAPAEAQVLPSAVPFTFTWHPTGIARRRTVPADRAPRAGGGWTGWPSLIAEAQAHCPPFNGVGYAVVFRANGQEILRAETAHTSYTPTADAWRRLRGAQGTVELRVEVGRFATSALTTGPEDQSVARHFTIGP